MPSIVARAVLPVFALLAAAPLAAQVPTRMMGAPYHDPSRAFLDLMIPHHDMAIAMAEHAVGAARSDSVKALARRMLAGQREELAELKATRRALFGSDSSRSGMMQGMMQAMGMQHMRDSGAARMPMDSMRMPSAGVRAMPMPMDSMRMRDTAMRRMPMDSAGMRPRQPMMGQGGGAAMPAMGDVDAMFLHHMISHHLDGSDMAILAEDGQAVARVKELARKIRASQEREVAEMRRLLAALPGTPPAGHRR